MKKCVKSTLVAAKILKSTLVEIDMIEMWEEAENMNFEGRKKNSFPNFCLFVQPPHLVKKQSQKNNL